MGNQRILKGSTATLTYTNLDADGSSVDTAGVITCSVAAGDGTTLATPAVTHSPTAPGIYSATLTPAQTAQLTHLTATWSDTAAGARTTEHDIVGGFLFTVDDMRNFEALGNAASYPLPRLIAARSEVEDELERLREAAFNARYARLTLDGSGGYDIVTGLSYLRTLRTATIYGAALSTTAIGNCLLTQDGRIRRTDGNVWDYGIGNVVVEVEHGFTDWGVDLQQAALMRLRSILVRPNKSTPDRAKSYTQPDGTFISLIIPDELSTGIPEVDAVYARYPRHARGDQPTSLTMSFTPQAGGLFRGWGIRQ